MLIFSVALQKFPARVLLFMLTLSCLFLFNHCMPPAYLPQSFQKLEKPEALGQASQQLYQMTLQSKEKKEKLKYSQGGMVLAEKCLKKQKKPICLYYSVLNRGNYIKNHIPNYQRSLKKMIQQCEELIKLQADYKEGGCYRVLGNIYTKAPSFSMNPKNITQDLDKALYYLKLAIETAPHYPLNYLFFAQTLSKKGQEEAAKENIRKFDSLDKAKLDRDYPEWEKEVKKIKSDLDM